MQAPVLNLYQGKLKLFCLEPVPEQANSSV